MADREEIEGYLEDAEDEGLSKEASEIMIANLDTVALAGCQGVDANLIPTDDVTLVLFLLDGSSSMDQERDSVVESYRVMVEDLRNAKSAESILLETWVFNSDRNLIHGFLPVTEVPDIGSQYYPIGSTALYATALAGLTGLVAYRRQLLATGRISKNAVVVLSDGEDNASGSITPGQVRLVAADLLAQEIYRLIYAGFTERGVMNEAEAKQLAAAIGFNEVWTKTTGSTGTRRLFGQFSQSIIDVSMGKIGPGQSSTGFFGP